jgi:TonB family protein
MSASGDMTDRVERPKTETSGSGPANVEHAWTLVRWIGIPIVLVAALYFVERIYDERPYVVVTDRGAMPDQFALPPLPAQPPAPAPTAGAPPAPLVPAPAETAAPPDVAVALHPISQPSPPYPPRALDAGKEGTVRLRLTIAPDGQVSDAVAIHGDPPGWFERAAESGAKHWRYAPPGRAVTTEVDVEFKLN